jgi:sec-independent protein translocase protein TatB
MFDVSFTEMMVIGVIALIVIGPERLPKVARTIGHLLGRAQRYVSDVKSDIRREIELDELRKFKSEMDEAAHNVKTSLRETETTIRGELDTTASEANQALAEIKQQAQATTPSSPIASASPSVPPAAVLPETPSAATAAVFPETATAPAPPATPSSPATASGAPASDKPTTSTPQPKTPTTP